MKNIYLLILILLFTGCKKARELTYFNIERSAVFTVPPTLGIGVTNLPSIPVRNDAESDFKNNNTKSKYVEEITLQEARLSIISSTDQNFNFLNSIEVYISAPGVAEMLLASQPHVPENVTSFDLITTKEPVDAYIKADNFSLRFSTVTDEILTTEVKVKADMKYRVRAKVF